jgi:hypothetical protein
LDEKNLQRERIRYVKRESVESSCFCLFRRLSDPRVAKGYSSMPAASFSDIRKKNTQQHKFFQLRRQETPNSVGGRKPMYQIQATVAMEQ